MAIGFKGDHFPKSVVLYAVFFYLGYPGSYRDLQEIMAERGVNVDHATLNVEAFDTPHRLRIKLRSVSGQRLALGES